METSKVKYYVGSGKDLLFPQNCDGPFDTPEDAKEFLARFNTDYMSPEMINLTIITVTNDCIDLYKENGEVVNMRNILNENNS